MNGNKIKFRNKTSTILIILSVYCSVLSAAQYQDRIVWIFGWGLNSDNDVAEIKKVIKTASENGFNAAMMSAGLDTLCKQNTNYLRRLSEVLQCCKDNKIEFIPAVFSVGYGGGALAHNRHLAEGVPVSNALFSVS